MRYVRYTIILMAVTFFSASVFAQEPFVKSAVIEGDTLDVGGVGNIIAGVDFDGDTYPEIYAVNNDWFDVTTGDWIPRIHKYENDGSGWTEVWGTRLALNAQNTWPALTYGDVDGDSKMEIYWGPVNNFGADDSLYARIVVFEQGTGDVLGIDDGAGGYLPNASWTITDEANYNLRPFKWVLNDIDNDGDIELIFSGRAGAEKFGVVSVDNIPDDGDGSETWTLEESALDTNLTISGGTFYDMAVLDSTIYLFDTGGDVDAVTYSNGTYSSATIAGGVPGGSWKSSSVVDLDGDSKNEIVIASNGSLEVYLLQETSPGVLTRTTIKDISSVVGSGGRLYGGASGDIDGDGNLDFVFGSRGTTPNGSIFRLSYTGGDITDEANYTVSRIDDNYPETGGRYDVIAVGNLDGDTDLEVAYAGVPDGSDLIPITILDRVAVPNLISIAEARVDTSGNPVTVVGVITSTNFTASANRFSYYIQDETAGINITKGGETGGGTVYNIGDRVTATGVRGEFNGTIQLNIADLSDVSLLDTNRYTSVTNLTVDQYLADPQSYEGLLIQLNAVAVTSSSDAWPSADNNANLAIWDGNPASSILLRIDLDTDIDNNPEPTWPINVKGIATVFSGDYQISPSFYSDITQGVASPPSPYFHILSPADGSVITIDSAEQVVDFTWEKPVDFNNDPLAYQVNVLGESPIPATDTTVSLTGAQIAALMGTEDTVTISFTIITKGAEANLVSSVDTVTVTFINNVIVGINDNQEIPASFYVNQNYPNPFNPSTTISFGLPSQSNVDLRIFNILGQQVAVLINNESRSAGRYNIQFNASNFASGTYIYRLTSGSNVVTKKMILMK